MARKANGLIPRQDAIEEIVIIVSFLKWTLLAALVGAVPALLYPLVGYSEMGLSLDLLGGALSGGAGRVASAICSGGNPARRSGISGAPNDVMINTGECSIMG